MRRPLIAAGSTAAALVLGLLTAPSAMALPAQDEVRDVRYAVLFEEGTSVAAGTAAVAAAGGTVRAVNAAIGEATVDAGTSFAAAAAAQPGLLGAARNTVIGEVPGGDRTDRDTVERLESERVAALGAAGSPDVVAGAQAAPGAGEPLGPLQWDNQMIGATPTGSYSAVQGTHDVLVGVMDTGVDASHPDIAPNFNRALSRNFTTDIPAIDGPCAEDPDGSCDDPADVDEDGHGTHVAGTIGAAINGIGISGVAPGVSLVNLRAGQDSGYFFLQSVVDAMTYAGDAGIDVVNMSFYIDPWLFNCTANPADSPAEQQEQRTVITATQRAIDYARARGTTFIAAEGNGNTDLGKPMFDDTSPDFPVDSARERVIDNTCLNVPTESDGVISITSLGASQRKAYYSDYGIEQADFSAPGGDFRDPATQIGVTESRDPRNLILSAYPKSLAIANGELNEDGTSNTPFVVVDQGATYQYLQGTSMAAPHAAGVAALAVARFGFPDFFRGGKWLDPRLVEFVMLLSTQRHECPTPATLDYPDLPDEFTATCEGSIYRNGFYGVGIVSAANVAGAPR